MSGRCWRKVSTMRRWINENDWNGVRKTLLTSRQSQLEQLYALLEKITLKMNEAQDVNPKDVDLVVKYTAAIKNLHTEVDIPQIVEVAKLFTTWLRRIDKDVTKTVALHFDAFIKERLKPFI